MYICIIVDHIYLQLYKKLTLFTPNFIDWRLKHLWQFINKYEFTLTPSKYTIGAAI